MIEIFARRSKVATRAIAMTDVLTPVQVRVFSDCEMRWFYQHLLAVPDPPTASMALDGAIGAALMTNFRHKQFLSEGTRRQNGVFVQDFSPGQDTTGTRRRLAGFDPDLVTESFDFSPDGSSLHKRLGGWYGSSGQPS